MSEDQKALVFRVGEEYKVVVEGYSRYKNSHFAEVYEQAGRQVEKIISRNRHVAESQQCEGDFYNNILAFIGDRGTGKTSCMQSFSNLLSDEKYKKTLKDKNMKFNDLGIVDPSMFDDRGNLLELVLATMFKRFKKKVESNNSNESQKRETLEQFNKVYKNLQHLNGKKEELYKGDAIDALVKLSAANDFKSNFKNLVDSYLKYMSKDSDNQENVLIIQIDDIDLNTAHAYEMVEQIRKYMIQPNLLILMAVKLPQLFDAIKQQLIIENKALLNEKSIDVKELASMTEKYLGKLIPVEHRLFLPKLEDFDRSLPLVVESDDSKKEPFRADSVESGVRELIYTRTGMYFTSPKYHENYIVPNNLRELNNLVITLYDMEKVKDTAKEKASWIIKECFNKKESEVIPEKNLIVNLLIKMDEEEIKRLFSKAKSDNPEKKGYDFPKKLKEFIGLYGKEVEYDSVYKKITDEFKNTKNEKKNAKAQLEWFKSYFIETWCYNHLEDSELDIISNFVEKGANEKNKYIVYEINNRIKELMKNEEDGKESLKTDLGYSSENKKEKNYDKYRYVVEINNNSLNISLGDVLYVLDTYRKFDMSDDAQKFVFSIKTLYSITFYDYYNKKQSKIEQKSLESNWAKAIALDDYTEYDLLFGGSIYNINHKKILKDERDAGMLSRDERTLNTKDFKAEDNIDNFISLFIRNLHNQELTAIDYRKQNEIWYDRKTTNSGVEKARFNILMALFNLGVLNSFGKNSNYFNRDNFEKYYPEEKIDDFYIGNIEMVENLLNHNFAKLVGDRVNDNSDYGEYVIKFWCELMNFVKEDYILFFSFYNTVFSKIFRKLLSNRIEIVKKINIMNDIKVELKYLPKLLTKEGIKKQLVDEYCKLVKDDLAGRIVKHSGNVEEYYNENIKNIVDKLDNKIENKMKEWLGTTPEDMQKPYAKLTAQKHKQILVDTLISEIKRVYPLSKEQVDENS